VRVRLRRGQAVPIIHAAAASSDSQCILWPGSLNALGYGTLQMDSETWLAHRAAYYVRYGEVPALLRHTCDTPNCINPTHLIAGSSQDNMDDMVQRGRQCKGDARATKLTSKDVAYIRAHHTLGTNRWQTGNTTALAERFNVCREFILDIARGSKWRE